MKMLITAVVVLVIGTISAHAANYYVASKGCITYADAGAAHKLWKNPVVREHFEKGLEISAEEQQGLVIEICTLAELSDEYPDMTMETDFFTVVVDSTLYDVWVKSGVLNEGSGVSALGLYAALYELSRGNQIPR